MGINNKNKIEFNERLIIESGVYRHYKGKKYRVIGVAKNSETLEDMVIYKALYGAGQLWVRPKEMFLEKINFEGKLVPRFRLIEKDEKIESRGNKENF